MWCLSTATFACLNKINPTHRLTPKKWIARTSGRILFLAFALTCAFSFSLEHAVADISWGFSQSKKIAKELYKQNKRSFYCNCQIVFEGARLSPDVKDCGYVPRNNNTGPPHATDKMQGTQDTGHTKHRAHSSLEDKYAHTHTHKKAPQHWA